MSEESKIDPRHSITRVVLRTLGPIIAALGLILTVIGFGSFLASFGTFESPRYFWCAFVGLPLLFVGTSLCMLAFLGSFARYVFGEAAPVQKDTFNYLAEGTKGGLRTVAKAVGEGLTEGMQKARSEVIRCPNCHHDNDTNAKSCKNCGSSLTK
jgi:hypothetical protein